MEKRKRTKTKLIVFSVVVFCVLALYHLSSVKKDEVITFGMFAGGQWDAPNEDCYRIIDEAIKDFEQEYPNVKVKYISGIQKSDYSEWITKRYVDGEMPDVFIVLPEDFRVFAETGVLKKLDKLIAEDSSFHKEDFYEGCYEAGSFLESQYAIPYESDPTLLFMNNTLLKEDNITIDPNELTWSEFYRVCSAMTKDENMDGKLDQFGVYDYGWKEAVYSSGGKIFDEEANECNLTKKDVKSALEFTKIIHQLSGYQMPSSDDFDVGKVAFRPMKFSEFRTYKPYPYKINKYTNFEWDCAQLPKGDQSKFKNYTDTILVGMNSKTTKENYAWLFLKKLTYAKETQAKIFKYSQGVSPLIAVTNSDETQKQLDSIMEGETGVRVSLLNDVMNHSVSREKIKGYDGLIDYCDGRITNLFMDNASMDLALQDIKSIVDRMME